jgi:hypothetical protein
MCVESQKKKTMKHACCCCCCCCVGFFSHSISSMHKTLSHTHSFSQKRSHRQLQKPQKRNKWFLRNNSNNNNNNNNKLDSSTIADTLESINKDENTKKTSSTRPAVGGGVRVSRPTTTCLTSARLGFEDARVLTVPSHPVQKNHPPVQ